MSELGTVHAVDDTILTAAQWNAGLRRSSREWQDLMKVWMFGDSAPSAGAGGVLGGLLVDNVTGQMQVTVSAGAAFYYDATLSDPLSPFGLVLLQDGVTKTVTAADATNDRIDVVSIKSPTGTDTSASVLKYDASPSTEDTQRGAVPVVTVTAGTPAGSPSAPATPSGEIKLCEILVPAAVSDLDTATITDSRVLSAGLMNRDGTGNMPMLTQSGRTWWRRVHAAAGFDTAVPGSTTISMTTASAALGSPVVIANGGASSGTLERVVPIPCDVRGLYVVNGKVHVGISDDFDGTVSILAQLVHVSPAGVVTVVAGKTIANSTASPADLDMDNAAPSEVEVTGEIYAYLKVTISSGGSGGSLELYGFGAQFREPLPTL